MQNIILIGLGYHARRIYYPILAELQEKGIIGRIFIVDLKSQSKIINDYLIEKRAQRMECFFLDRPQNDILSREVEEKLNSLVHKHSIKGTIISTEPLAHMVYAKWAIKNHLSVLMDKPISTYEGIICNERYARKLVKDYDELSKEYQEAQKTNKEMVFAVMAQRRFHNSYRKIKKMIDEVYRETKCPITSIQSFHSDGQWRFPTEIIEQNNHPYNQGYGKCSHSGYHFFDLVSWLMNKSDKNPDVLEVMSSCLTPVDFVNQYTFEDYRRDFKDFDKYNCYSEKEFIKKAKNFGEIDSFSNFTFKKKGKVMTLASINLCHNGFSQRNWPTAMGKDLYKGNGRVRHESHYILQGPFQAISYISYQSKEVDPNQQNRLFDVGGEYHADIYVFRNSTFNPKWRSIERFNVRDLVKFNLKNKSRGHQEEARREAILSFIDNLQKGNRKIAEISDLSQFARSVKMMSGVYQSMARRKKDLNPLVRIKL